MAQLDSDAILIKIKEDGIDSENILVLAQNTNALSQDGLKFFDMTNIQNDNWINYCEVISDFINQKDPKKIRRFRRLVPPERIVKLADMLYLIYKNSK